MGVLSETKQRERACAGEEGRRGFCRRREKEGEAKKKVTVQGKYQVVVCGLVKRTPKIAFTAA